MSMPWENLLAAQLAAEEADRRSRAAAQAAQQAALKDPNSPEYKAARAAEAAAANQNTFNRGITKDTLGVSQQNSKNDQAYKQAQVQQAKDQLQFQYAQMAQTGQNQQGQLGLQTLQLGAGLRGPRDWLSYMDATAGAGQNPLLQQAVGTWADLTNNRPRGTGAWQGATPQKFDLNALASDFGLGSGSSSGSSPRIAALDTVARNPGQAAPGWWQSLGPDAQEMAKGYWEKNGDSADTILNRLSYTAPTNSFGYNGI